MMRFLIITLVVVVFHLMLLAWLLGACRATTGERGESRAQPAAAGSPSEQQVPGTTPRTTPETPAADSGAAYGPGFFRDRIQPLPAPLAAQVSNCRAGILIDWTSRNVFWSKRPDEPQPIASLTKMMTVLLLMQDLERRSDLSLDAMIPVTVPASKVGGRQVWLDPRESFSIEDLLQCILIRSANDCAYLVGEFLAEGDYDEFIRRMNRSGRSMGLDTLTFYNSHGLPVPGSRKENQGSPRQLAYLAGRLLDYEEVTRWTSTRLSYIREDSKPFQLVNTNKLITTCPGVNGMKTGYTDQSGYCLAATCERAGRTVIAVVLGCPSSTSRDTLVQALIEWAYNDCPPG